MTAITRAPTASSMYSGTGRLAGASVNSRSILRLEAGTLAAQGFKPALVVALRRGAGRGEEQRRDAVPVRADAAPVELFQRRLDVVARPDVRRGSR